MSWVTWVLFLQVSETLCCPAAKILPPLARLQSLHSWLESWAILTSLWHILPSIGSHTDSQICFPCQQRRVSWLLAPAGRTHLLAHLAPSNLAMLQVLHIRHTVKPEWCRITVPVTQSICYCYIRYILVITLLRLALYSAKTVCCIKIVYNSSIYHRAEVHHSFITTTVLDKSQVSQQGLHCTCKHFSMWIRHQLYQYNMLHQIYYMQ